jgi:hypothetical protein
VHVAGRSLNTVTKIIVVFSPFPAFNHLSEIGVARFMRGV